MFRATLCTWGSNEISLLNDSTRSFWCCNVNVWLMGACLVYKPSKCKTLGYRPIEALQTSLPLLKCFQGAIPCHWAVWLFLNIPPCFGMHFLPIKALLLPSLFLWCTTSALTGGGENMLSSGYEHLAFRLLFYHMYAEWNPSACWSRIKWNKNSSELLWNYKTPEI